MAEFMKLTQKLFRSSTLNGPNPFRTSPTVPLHHKYTAASLYERITMAISVLWVILSAGDFLYGETFPCSRFL